ncbi:lysophospholipid acyltransferase family protein [Pseudarthrobacter sp. J1763]|uniref:lysophospholipid acyltransferase family protein n=1 Tax=Pseudarthrobacter sp. J1763 TaxID=3420445 RepID=UPI003D26E997
MSETLTARATFAFLAGVLRPIMNALMSKDWRGLEKLPEGGFIAVPNHCTELDPVAVGHMLYSNKRPPHFLAKAGLFDVPVFGKLLRSCKQIPVERTGVGANGSLTVAQEVVDGGGSIVIFPEGTLTRDPDLWPMKGKTGAARLALQTGVPVVPIAQWGAHEVFPRYGKRLHVFPRKTSRVLVGDPVDLSEFQGRPMDKATLTAATEKIMDAITVLLEELRGEKAPEERWDPAQHGQSAHGRVGDRGENQRATKPGATE